jgi:hypothetical protein
MKVFEQLKNSVIKQNSIKICHIQYFKAIYFSNLKLYTRGKFIMGFLSFKKEIQIIKNTYKSIFF